MIREYEDRDYESICKWLTLRDMPPIPEWSLPPHGMIVEGVACGFLIVMDNNFGMLDFYISNPHSDKSSRDKALDHITHDLINLGKDLSLKMILCSTKSRAVKERARKHGFRSDGQFTNFILEV